LGAAEALLFHGCVGFAVCLKAYPDTRQGQGQRTELALRLPKECPLHTDNVKSKIKVNGDAAGVRGFRLSQKTRKMGHALLFLRKRGQARLLLRLHLRAGILRECSCSLVLAGLGYNYWENLWCLDLLCWFGLVRREGCAIVEDEGRIGAGDGPAENFIPWIFAEADFGWREERNRNPKRLGERSQAAFLLKAQSLGFGLAVPWGDSEKFDFVVWAGPGGRLMRVQVKATGRLHRGGYDVQPVYSTRGEGKKRYTAREIDVLAAHVVLQEGGDVWYLLPVRRIVRVKSLRFFPGVKGRNPRWEGYREAWEWLEGE
jgi:PD-(D/E)XK endonuclease